MDHQNIEKKLSKLNSDVIRLNLMVSSLYVFAFELLRTGIVEGTRTHFVPEGEYSDEQLSIMKESDRNFENFAEETGTKKIPTHIEYHKNKLEKFENKVGKSYKTSDNHLLLPCAEWLQNMGGIDSSDVRDIKRIRNHRNSIVHELPMILFDTDIEVDIELINRIREILRKIDIFWFRMDDPINPLSGEFINTSEINDEEVFSGRYAFLTLSIEAVIEYEKKYN